MISFNESLLLEKYLFGEKLEGYNRKQQVEFYINPNRGEWAKCLAHQKKIEPNDPNHIRGFLKDNGDIILTPGSPISLIVMIISI
jgi:hypothetical protein